MVGEKEVENVLKDCLDPELQISIVDLGLIYGIKNDNGKITITMTLTTPGCPLMSMLFEDIQQKVKKLPDVSEVVIDLTFDPPWTPDKMSEEAKQKLGF